MTSWRAYLSALQVAMMMMTRLPVGRVNEPVPSLTEARWAFPLAGVPVGGIGWLICASATGVGLGPTLAALLAMAGMALATGALHHDGLADFADGIGGGRDKAQALEIMRDSRIGSYGVLALIFVLALQMTAIQSVVWALPWAAFLFLAVASRTIMLAVLEVMPAAREDGLGKMAAGPRGAMLWPGLGLAVVLGLVLGAKALGVVAVMAAVGALLAWVAQRKIGGQTGDVLGAVQIGSETAGWIALAGLMPHSVLV